jgi:AcrR family transcriptional regulator
MTNEQPPIGARERVLDAAEQLFAQRGYAAVTLRDIGAAVGIRHASLYHHVPGGKEELYVEVTERHLQRHQAGLTQAITAAQPTMRAQLHAAAGWLLSQPPMDLLRMVHSDMPAIDAQHAERLSRLAYAALIEPIAAALSAGQVRGEIRHPDLPLIAGGLLGMIESMYAAPPAAFEHAAQTRQSMAATLIDVVLDGLRPRRDAAPQTPDQRQ